MTCDAISSGNCLGWHPVGGFNTSNDCLGLGSGSTQSTDTICVTSWWPLLCGDDSSHTCVGFNRYANITACGGEDADSYSATSGYCVTSWWPMTCDAITSGNCLGWYPPGGYATSDACTGTTSSGKSLVETLIKNDILALEEKNKK